MRADLHLHAAHTLLDPLAELPLEALGRVRREPAAPVDRHAIADRAEQAVERLLEELRFQIPERGIDRRQRHRCDARLAEVPDLATERGEHRGRRERVLAHDPIAEIAHHAHHCRAPVAVAEPARPPPSTCTVTSVVLSHANVPSASGPSVGTRKA
jgi:hypothetical protein